MDCKNLFFKTLNITVLCVNHIEKDGHNFCSSDRTRGKFWTLSLLNRNIFALSMFKIKGLLYHHKI